MKNDGFSGGGRSQWPSYIHEKDGVIRLDRFILRAGKGFMPMPQRYCEARGEGFLLHRVAQPPYASRLLRELRETGVGFLDTRLTFNGEMTKPRLDQHRVFRQDLGLMGRKGAIY